MGLFIRVATLTFTATVAFAATAHADDSLARAEKNGVVFGFSNEPLYASLSAEGKPAGTWF
ncbi:hypothetical protein ACNJYD_09310 [Bradyrhizobium sp. DASA03005]|uniref:hypothetical protein n=1 Tax=Bradyrhizobium sp. SPXBL-02 TaxID=3395912 RepID=UPI003F703DCF